MKYNIIGLAGPARVGKDTIADEISIILDKQCGCKICKKYAFALPLKQIICALLEGNTLGQIRKIASDYNIQMPPECCIEDEYETWQKIIEENNLSINSTKEEYRPLIQYVGTDSIRKYHSDAWTRPMIDFISKDPNKIYIISDVRFRDEANAILNLGGIVVLLDRKGRIEKETDNHSSEQQFNSMPYDMKLVVSDGWSNLASAEIVSLFRIHRVLSGTDIRLQGKLSVAFALRHEL